ncbi:MAG: cupin domain-containing protein [Dehalococcoidia bacterium]|jgi:mannose-6-phosphate isomerase-like protein (cupin superfamily)|nr:cupin domain-containing protein [Dehalococcoidia bacterium]
MTSPAQTKNLTVTRHANIMGRHPVESPWAEVLIEDGRNRVVWISGPPGTPPDPHIHPDFNECWIILDGKTRYQIGQYEPVDAGWGDIVIAPAGFAHDIRPVEGDQAIRLGITHPDSNHDIKGVPPSRLIPVDEGLSSPNLIHTSMDGLLETHGSDSNWKELAVLDSRNRLLITHELPGTVNRRYWHPDMDKWWAVVAGKIEFSISDQDPVTAGPGDLVFVPGNTSHNLLTVGDKPSIRITVTAPDIVHHYTDDADAPVAPNG